MARLPRLDVPGVAQHIVQRGVDRQVCFVRADDYAHYLNEVEEAAPRHGCHLHAYALMTNHVHLLVTACVHGATSRMMQAIGRRYVACFNARYRRSGTLWEGRFKSALVGSESYALACYRYIELNPVRAGMTTHPADYPLVQLSMQRAGRVRGAHQSTPSYLQLGADDADRQSAYRDLVVNGLSQEEADALRLHAQQQRAWGHDRFQAQIEALTQRTVTVRPRGWPSTARK